MKVLLISAAFPPMRAGEADHALQLCLRLAERGETVHVLTMKGCTDTGRLPFTVHPLMSDWSWTELPRLARFIKKCHPDAISLLYSGWIYNDHPMITFVATVAKRLFPAVPFVTMLAIEQGSSWRTFMSRVVRKTVKFWAGSKAVDIAFGTLLRDSDSIILWSEHHLARFSALAPGVHRKGLVIPPPPLMRMCPQDNGATRERGRAQLGVRGDEFLLAFFGYVVHGKGIETLLKAVQLVSASIHNVRLVMIGGGRGSVQAPSGQLAREREIVGYEEKILRYSEQLGITDRVMWLSGYNSDSDTASMYLYAADACVLPFDQGVTLSRSSLSAALAHGTPVITTRGVHLETPFQHEVNVFLCPPKDPDALALAICRVVSSPDLRLKLTEGAGQLAREWFSWEKAVTRLMETFQRGS